jgi:hypothetical protein
MKLEFSRQILEERKKKAQTPNFIKIRPVGAEFHVGGRASGRTDAQT